MKLFECQNCGQALYFENTHCESCGLWLGYLPAKETVTALEDDAGRFRALADPNHGRYRYCANVQHGVCNWLIPEDSPDQFCAACRHNRTIPDLSIPQNLMNWRKIEGAKHRLFYTLLRLRLPLTTRDEDAEGGLAFDFIAPPAPGDAPVMIGHKSGLITISLAEADDSERERQRREMGEPYRTLLGHFRHEVAHYYWDHLIRDTPALEEFRRLFGDERQDYREALQKHYAEGPPNNWVEQYVTAYASVHPWEDFAETWAHYFHMVDTLETANAFGLRLRPKVGGRGPLDRGRFRSAYRQYGPHHRLLAAADLCGEFDQPQHGHCRPLPVRAGAGGHHQAVVHPRSHPCRRGPSDHRSGAGGATRRHRRPQARGRRPRTYLNKPS